MSTKTESNESPLKEKLDQFVVNIEFLLISVVQGVALAALATSAVGPISNFELQYYPYVISAFLFILTFWSQAIIHTLSFIDWPLDMLHNFLYFLLAFIEVMAFSQIQNPLKWFEFVLVFFIIAGILYAVDLALIRAHKHKYNDTLAEQALYKDIHKRETFEFATLVPAGIVVNIVSILLIQLYPEYFIAKGYHVFLIGFQVVFGLVALANSLKSFKKRSRLISNLYLGQ